MGQVWLLSNCEIWLNITQYHVWFLHIFLHIIIIVIDIIICSYSSTCFSFKSPALLQPTHYTLSFCVCACGRGVLTAPPPPVLFRFIYECLIVREWSQGIAACTALTAFYLGGPLLDPREREIGYRCRLSFLQTLEPTDFSRQYRIWKEEAFLITWHWACRDRSGLKHCFRA